MCDLYSALFLWYNYLLITLRILYHRLFVSEIAFLKNGQKKTSKSFELGGLIPATSIPIFLSLHSALLYTSNFFISS